MHFVFLVVRAVDVYPFFQLKNVLNIFVYLFVLLFVNLFCEFVDIMRRTRRGRGRGRRGNSVESPGMARVIRHPAEMPEIREQLVGQRWVRTYLTSTFAGLHQVKIADVLPNLFSGADTGRSAFYLHRLRVYGPQLNKVASGTTPAELSVPTVTVNVPLKPLSTGASFPFQRFVDSGMLGASRACVAVEMPKFWQDFPLAHDNSDTVLCEITNFVANAVYHLDMFVTISYSPQLSSYVAVLTPPG